MRNILFSFILGIGGLAGAADSSFEFIAGNSPSTDIVRGPVKVTFSSTGCMRGSEKGKHFIRLRQNADDPGHRARISFLLPKKEKPFAFDSFTISAIARMEEKRNGDFYLLQLQNVRLGMRGGKPYVFVASKKKSFHLFADMKKAEFIPGEWSHIHLSVNRNGDLALYVNGEAVTSCDISDRKEENWMPDSVVRILAYNQKADADNPIANMDVMRIKVKSGLMSTAQIREEAGQWLSE